MNTKNNENTILFTIGRMNPPTSGHMLLIREMMKQALEKNVKQINILLSATVDNKKNPLTCGEKRFFLLNFMIHHLRELMKIENPTKREQIDEIQVKIVCMDDVLNPNYGKHPILKSIEYILRDLYSYPRENLKMILMIGEDREKDYFWIQKSLQERNPPITVEILGLDRPEGAMSATYIRQLALNGDLETFRKEMEVTGLNEESILKVYNEIREKLVVSSKKRKGGGSKKIRKGCKKTCKRRKTCKTY